MKTKNKKPPHLEWVDGKEKPRDLLYNHYLVWMDEDLHQDEEEPLLRLACGYFHENSWWIFEVSQDFAEPLFDSGMIGVFKEEARSAVFTKVKAKNILAWAQFSH